MRMRPEDGMRSASNRTSPTPSFTRATVITLIIEVALQRCRYGLSHQLFRLSALPSETLWCPITVTSRQQPCTSIYFMACIQNWNRHIIYPGAQLAFSAYEDATCVDSFVWRPDRAADCLD